MLEGDVSESFRPGQFAGALDRGAEMSTPKELPALAVRAACRVVSPVPQPMSSTWSRYWTPAAWRNTSLCRRSSAS
jgi:hypothetical protein